MTIFANARLASRDVEGVLVKVLSLEDQLIRLCAQAHYHGYTQLNCFSDIAFIVRDHAAQLEWERLLSRRYGSKRLKWICSN